MDKNIRIELIYNILYDLKKNAFNNQELFISSKQETLQIDDINTKEMFFIKLSNFVKNYTFFEISSPHNDIKIALDFRVKNNSTLTKVTKTHDFGISRESFNFLMDYKQKNKVPTYIIIYEKKTQQIFSIEVSIASKISRKYNDMLFLDSGKFNCCANYSTICSDILEEIKSKQINLFHNENKVIDTNNLNEEKKVGKIEMTPQNNEKEILSEAEELEGLLELIKANLDMYKQIKNKVAKRICKENLIEAINKI